MSIASDAEEGLYNLYFHSCPNYEANKQVALDFTVNINFVTYGNECVLGCPYFNFRCNKYLKH